MTKLLPIALLLGAGCASLGWGADAMEDGFTSPPASTRPWCYWYWISDNISRDGITRDLEAMARVGIGEVLIGNVVDPDTPLGDVRVFSDAWWALLEHAVREGRRVGVDISVFNGPGWSQSGGPWNSPKQAMRYVVSSETRVKGPTRFASRLPAPKEPFQDIAVLAFPAPLCDGETIRIRSPRARCIPPVANSGHLVDGDPETGCVFPPGSAAKERPFVVDIELAESFMARSLTLHPHDGDFFVQCHLQVPDDAGAWRTVRRFPLDRRGLARPQYAVNVGPMIKGPAVVAFAPVTSRCFRLEITSLQGAGGLAEITLSGAARLDSVVEKQLGKMHATPLPRWDSYHWPPSPEPDSRDLSVSLSAVRDLSDKLGPDGTLQWDVPEGEWIILRSGMTPTGAVNHPTTEEGRGLECDKMNRDAVEAHFNGFVGKLLDRLSEADRAALHHVVIDSYEVGPQNWTDGFEHTFQSAYGYDPRPWLPVLTGRIVGNADQSDRFLWDLRRLVADRIAQDYVGGLRDVSRRHGLRLWLENYGHWGFPAEFLQYGGQSDDLGGEFWVRDPANRVLGNLGSVELRAASSAAHLYGKPVVYSEAFTSARSFRDSPANIKVLGDWAYCQGINHFVLHVYIHQPWEDRKPGVNAWFGTEFNRHNTWFEQSKAWIDYLRRCHFLLQQGHSTADVAYFIGEDTPQMTGTRQPELPPGYDYDYINAEAILSRVRVDEGRLTVPDGPAYSLLVLPPLETMRPELLRRIRDLVSEGAALFGPPPKRSPSLQDYPGGDLEVQRLAAELWGELEQHEDSGLADRKFGKGRVFRGNDMAEALRRLDVAPAIACPSDVLWTLRKTKDADIYFLSNQKARPALFDISFRVAGRTPEFWHPDTGAFESTAWFSSEAGRTRVPLSLDPYGSVFVVFRKRSTQSSVVKVSKDGQPLEASAGASPIRLTGRDDGGIVAAVTRPGRYSWTRADGKQVTLDASALPAPVSLPGPWQLSFPEGSGSPMRLDLAKLISWSDSPDEKVRHFSGVATYETRFQVPPEMLGPGRRLTLDLGRVDVIAEVRVNGEDLGTLWKWPFVADITQAVSPGANTLHVKVANNWWNRLAGDDKLPADQRTTFTTARPRTPRNALLSSGLLGPVRMQPSLVREFRP